MKKENAPKSKRWRKVLKTAKYSLFQDAGQTATFEVSWKRAGGSYGRRRFNAQDVEQAIAQAPIVAGLIVEKPDIEGVRLLDGFSLALAETRRSESSRRHWLYQQTRFIEWLLGAYPAVTHWHQVTRKVIKEYVAYLGDSSPNTRRLMMQPITQTAGYLEREYQLPNVTGKLGIGNATVRPTPAVFLRDVADLLDHLQAHAPIYEVGAALQGLAGLRVMETLRLTWGKVDLEQGLVEIGSPGQTVDLDNPNLKVKNTHSHRVIPVPARVLEALKRAWDRRPEPTIDDPEKPVIPLPTGGSYMDGTDTYKNYLKGFRLALKAWNAKTKWQVKDLRNAVPTALAMAKLSSDLSEQYLGHAAKGVTARHYIPHLATVTAGEKQAFDEAMAVLRTLVVGPIEQLLEQSKAEPKILKIFEQGQNKQGDEEELSQVV